MGAAVEHPVDRRHPLLVLDPNKCVLCGRCVRICSELVGRGRLRLRQPRLRHRGQARPRRLPARHRVRELRALHRHLPHGRHRREAAPGQARPLEDRRRSSPCVRTAASGAGSPTRSPAPRSCRCRRSEDNGGTVGNHCRKGRFGYGYVQSKDRLRWPLLRVGRELQETTLDEALRYAAHAAQGARAPHQRRGGGGLRLAPPDERGDLPRPEARAGRPAHAQRDLFRHLVNRELQAAGCRRPPPPTPTSATRRPCSSSTRRSTRRASRWTSPASRPSATAPASSTSAPTTTARRASPSCTCDCGPAGRPSRSSAC